MSLLTEDYDLASALGVGALGPEEQECLRLETDRLMSNLEEGEASGEEGESEWCPYELDPVLTCWPPTVGGEVAVIPCFEKFKDVLYDATSEFPTKRERLSQSIMRQLLISQMISLHLSKTII